MSFVGKQRHVYKSYTFSMTHFALRRQATTQTKGYHINHNPYRHFSIKNIHILNSIIFIEWNTFEITICTFQNSKCFFVQAQHGQGKIWSHGIGSGRPRYNTQYKTDWQQKSWKCWPVDSPHKGQATGKTSPYLGAHCILQNITRAYIIFMDIMVIWVRDEWLWQIRNALFIYLCYYGYSFRLWTACCTRISIFFVLYEFESDSINWFGCTNASPDKVSWFHMP